MGGGLPSPRPGKVPDLVGCCGINAGGALLAALAALLTGTFLWNDPYLSGDRTAWGVVAGQGLGALALLSASARLMRRHGGGDWRSVKIALLEGGVGGLVAGTPATLLVLDTSMRLTGIFTAGRMPDMRAWGGFLLGFPLVVAAALPVLSAPVNLVAYLQCRRRRKSPDPGMTPEGPSGSSAPPVV